MPTSHRYQTVTFLSDYGTADEFVGLVHSVIRSIAPEAHVIDLAHDIAPYDIRGAGLMLARSSPYLEAGVVLAVVDPGVGTERRAIAVEVGDATSVLVGPDNGLLAPAVAMCGGATRAVQLTNPEFQLSAPGPTFAGRDIFAPAAAHLCLGVPLSEFGDEIDAVTLLPGLLPISHLDGDVLVAEVLWVDRYGNAQLNVGPDEIEAFGDRVRVEFSGQTRTARRVETYTAIGANEIGLMIDSYGLVSIVVDQQSAAFDLGLSAGSGVFLSMLDADNADADTMGISTAVSLGHKSTKQDSIEGKTAIEISSE